MFVVLLNLMLKKIRYWNSVKQTVRSINHSILPLSARNASVKWMFSLRSNCPFRRKIHVYVCPLIEKFCRYRGSHSSWIFVLYVYVCLCMATLTEVYPCFFLSCQANTRVKPGKTGHGPHSSKFLCCSMYCLICVILCIVCVYMCTVRLPPGGYPVAVKYIIY